MTEQQTKISFLLDEFSDDEQGKALLDQVEGDVNLQYTMRRYQMIGEVLRHELPGQIYTGFSADVMAKIDQIESTVSLPRNRDSDIKNRRPLWISSMMKPFAGLAIAASVAVLSVSLWQSSNPDVNSGQASDQVVSAEQRKIERLASQTLPVRAVAAHSSIDNGMRWKIENNSPAMQQKLNAYLVNHTEYSDPMQGLISQARVAGFDER